VCTALTVCYYNEYESTPATATSDRVCTATAYAGGSNAPSKEPTVLAYPNALTPKPTNAPTIFPTFAPTTAATNPEKPAFDPTDAKFDVATMDVIADSIIGKQTLAPTNAPTAYPTEEGYVVVKQQEEAVVVAAALSFPLSQEEASDPVMQHSLVQGFAASLGVEASKVHVTHVNGEPVATASARIRKRALQIASSVQITFEVESASATPATVASLKESVKQAATDGAIVANVQRVASENGVLTSALAGMSRTLDAPTVTEGTRTVSVNVAVRSTDTPTSAPTIEDISSHGMMSSSSLGSKSSWGSKRTYIAVSVAGVLVVVMAGAMLVRAYPRQQEAETAKTADALDGAPKPLAVGGLEAAMSGKSDV
jgi:hypothetical protein